MAEASAGAGERDPRTGRLRTAQARPALVPSGAGAGPVDGPSGGGAGADGPERPPPAARQRAWRLAVGWATLALGLGVGVLVGVLIPPGGETDWFVPLAVVAVTLGYRAFEIGLRARSMSSGPGRFVFLDEHRVVRGSSRRWYLPTLGRQRWTGRWFHLTDAETEQPLGWVEVPERAVMPLRQAGVAALFGGGREGLRWTVLAGPAGTVRSIGSLRAELPQDLGFFDLPRANSSSDRWRGRVRRAMLRSGGIGGSRRTGGDRSV